jgi:DedD protein
MDRSVKERLVGASILVLLIVLIVPELLSGPAPAPVAPVDRSLPASAPEAVRNVTVDLATNRAAPQEPTLDAAASSVQPAETQSGEAASAAAETSPAPTTPSAPLRPSLSVVPLESEAPAPTTATRGPTATTATGAAAATATTVTTATGATTVPGAKGASAPLAQRHAWAVQLGSFASRANADKLVRHLKAQGFAVYEVPGGSGPSLRYRVRVGPMADRGAASQAAGKLKSLGQTPSLVAPAP